MILSEVGPGQQLNRLVTTAWEPNSGSAPSTLQGYLVFTDADTLAVQRFLLPVGYYPGGRIAMDRNGDVWLDDAFGTLLRKFSGSTGALLATVNHPTGVDYMVTDQQANLIVSSHQIGPWPGTSVFLHEYSTLGVLRRSLDLLNVLPPGTGPMLANTSSHAWGWGVPHVLVREDGGLWVAVVLANQNPVLRLNPNWTLAASYAIYHPTLLLPDGAGGVWVAHDTTSATLLWGAGTPMPGNPGTGVLHLSAQGVILESTFDANTSIYVNYGRVRSDGRQYAHGNQFVSPNPPSIGVHDPGNTWPWYPTQNRVVIAHLFPYPWVFGFELCGQQHLWTLRAEIVGSPTLHWYRSDMEPPYNGTREVQIDIGGEAWPVLVPNTYLVRTSFIGNNSLYRYAWSTDPWGGLDGDGVTNRTELLNFTNPFLPLELSSRPVATAVPAGPGGTFQVTWQDGLSAGLPYAAPFSLTPGNTLLQPGVVLPFGLQDPLVQISIAGSAVLTGTVGILDASGSAIVTMQIPPYPGLSGATFSTSLVTLDPATRPLLTTNSWPFTFTVQ